MRISDWSSDVCSSDLVQGSVFAACFDGLTVDKEQPDVAVFSFGKVLLCDDITVTADRLEHLVDVLRFLPRDEEHIAAPGPLKRQIGRASCRERVCQYV